MRRQAVVSRAGFAALLLVSPCVVSSLGAEASSDPVIPSTTTLALDDHAVHLPQSLSAPATVLILGFGRHSQEATTAWERPVRTQLTRPGMLDFFDMAMLAEVPGFLRPLIIRRIQHEVPDVLKPHFLTLADNEDAWKRVAGYSPDQAEAAYVLLVDRTGRVRWSTLASFSPVLLEQLRTQADTLTLPIK